MRFGGHRYRYLNTSSRPVQLISSNQGKMHYVAPFSMAITIQLKNRSKKRLKCIFVCFSYFLALIAGIKGSRFIGFYNVKKLFCVLHSLNV